jgi:hypothetical protein
MTDIAKIAAGLTEKQKTMLLEIGSGKPQEYALGQVGFALLRRKLVFVNELGARHITETGLAVRDSIKEQHHD